MRMMRMVVVIGVAAALLGAAAPSAGATSRTVKIVVGHGSLSDLSPLTADATDGASGVAVAVAAHGSTRVVMVLWGLDPANAGAVHGAHVHVGQCVAGSGATAGPHYNASGGTVVDATTEVWLDFTVGSSGVAVAATTVPFMIPAGGAGSIVLHAAPTATNGTAGARLACLPMNF